MDKNESSFKYQIFESADQLAGVDRNLYEQACEATNRSYAPYSNLKVGAALLFDNDEVVRGANYENGTFPLGVCAERASIYSAINATEFSRKAKPIAIAIAARYEDKEFTEISPCGECRQVLYELGLASQSKLRIIMPASDGTIVVIEDISSLLPFAFTGPRTRQKMNNSQ